MPRTSNFSYSTAPAIHRPRTWFPLSWDVKTSMDVGKLYPLRPIEVYPGDTFSLRSAIVARLSSAYIRPVMDNLVLEASAFWLPFRQIDTKWEEVITGGNASPNDWQTTSAKTVPYFETGEIVSGSVGDYLGFPLGSYAGKGHKCSLYPYRGFAKIYNEWFRNENVIQPMNIRFDNSAGSQEIPNDNAWSVNNYCGLLPSVGKKKDYFTSVLPQPQRGAAISLLDTVSSFLPLVAGDQMHLLGGNMALGFEQQVSGNGWHRLFGYSNDSITDNFEIRFEQNNTADSPSLSDTANVRSTNLGIHLDSPSIAAMRYEWQLQRILERAARSGSRYVEYLAAAWGLSTPDGLLQRTEFLGGVSIPLSQQPVDQTSKNDGDDYLGSQAAYSLSNGAWKFSKAFKEHGYIYVCLCIRQAQHTYQQGIPAMFSRLTRFSFYDPALMNTSEQPVYRKELFLGAPEDSVLGYKEAWSELRHFDNYITGKMRQGVDKSFSMMHFGDYFSNAPTLTKDFIEENPDNVNRTIQVSSKTGNPQFLVDIAFKGGAVRVLSKRSIPGLVDHN